MASHDLTTGARSAGRTELGIGRTARRLATETKQAFKTTEFWSFAAIVAAILISAALIKGGDSGSGSVGTDEFIARQAWLYVAIVTGCYLLSRGLAKAGSREPYSEDRDDDR
jgi:hypothetical protein